MCCPVHFRAPRHGAPHFQFHLSDPLTAFIFGSDFDPGLPKKITVVIIIVLTRGKVYYRFNFVIMLMFILQRYINQLCVAFSRFTNF